jgi:hypothetical protein
MELLGKVVRKSVGSGSKSERMAVVLVTADAEYVLRRPGGNAFADPELDALVGSKIRATGTLHGFTFLLESWVRE